MYESKMYESKLLLKAFPTRTPESEERSNLM